jgi:hypothetical protein
MHGMNINLYLGLLIINVEPYVEPAIKISNGVSNIMASQRLLYVSEHWTSIKQSAGRIETVDMKKSDSIMGVYYVTIKIINKFDNNPLSTMYMELLWIIHITQYSIYYG